MPKTNSDGSLRLGTLRMDELIVIAEQSGRDTEEFKALRDEYKKALKPVAEKTFNGLMVLIDPNSPESEQNKKVPFAIEAHVDYYKRKNPTRSSETKKELRAKKLAQLRADLDELDPSTPEFDAKLDEIVSL